MGGSHRRAGTVPIRRGMRHIAGKRCHGAMPVVEEDDDEGCDVSDAEDWELNSAKHCSDFEEKGEDDIYSETDDPDRSGCSYVGASPREVIPVRGAQTSRSCESPVKKDWLQVSASPLRSASNGARSLECAPGSAVVRPLLLSSPLLARSAELSGQLGPHGNGRNGSGTLTAADMSRSYSADAKPGNGIVTPPVPLYSRSVP